MTTTEMLEMIDFAIARLQQVRILLQEQDGLSLSGKGKEVSRKPISPEGRRKIADAQRARWVKVKQAMKL